MSEVSSASLIFDSDPRKAATNLRKHGVSFPEAISSFYDTMACSLLDESHSEPGDERLLNIGLSSENRLLVVVHNEEDGTIRIISARPATPAERALYEEA
jgi:uncharacterized DUF497 family protein